MLLGLAWPINALHMPRSRRAEGKSLGFTMIIRCGYLAGASSRIARMAGTGVALSPLFWLYMLDRLTVGLNAWLCCRYRRTAITTPGATTRPVVSHVRASAQ